MNYQFYTKKYSIFSRAYIVDRCILIIQPYPATQNRYGLIIEILHKINYIEIYLTFVKILILSGYMIIEFAIF
jgi:hypothetical protein